MVRRTVRPLVNSLDRARPSDGSVSSELNHSISPMYIAHLSTESIESLALVENYIPPGEEAPVDPILASVVSLLPLSVPPTPPGPVISRPTRMMKYFSDVNAFGRNVRERKTHVDNSVAFLLTHLHQSSYSKIVIGVYHKLTARATPRRDLLKPPRAARAPLLPVEHRTISLPSLRKTPSPLRRRWTGCKSHCTICQSTSRRARDPDSPATITAHPLRRPRCRTPSSTSRRARRRLRRSGRAVR